MACIGLQKQMKKIVITGPPNMGKTTIKKTFFDKENLVYPFENLQPTRGMSSSVYSFYDIDVSVFDLAGQENNSWLYDEKTVFEDSNAIICVFDVAHSLKFVISFILKIFRIKKELELTETPIIVFLHKVDLVSPEYVALKTKAIKNFFSNQYIGGKYFRITSTSVLHPYYSQTLEAILQVLVQITPISKHIAPNFRTTRNGNWERSKICRNELDDLHLHLTKKMSIYN
ncbi:MAG: ADP-ribosylation factor-like protein [Promethearchaeota archaeon]